jgi:hypothetical protein
MGGLTDHTEPHSSFLASNCHNGSIIWLSALTELNNAQAMKKSYQDSGIKLSWEKRKGRVRGTDVEEGVERQRNGSPL